jgi:hypothetical protein
VVDDGWAVEFDAGYRAWRGAVADGWTAADAVEREPARLRTGGARTGAPATGRRTPVPTGTGAPVPAARPTKERATGASSVAVRTRRPKLSKDAYRRRLVGVEAELTRLGLRRNHLELALGDPAVTGNFVELARVTSELADVDQALEAAEEAWLELEERAP